jgi:hypothetical protein
MESCLEAATTTKGNGLPGIEPKSISKMDLHRGARGSSRSDVLVNLRLRMCQLAMLIEASNALRYFRAWTIFCGKGGRTKGLAQMSFLSSTK